MEYKQRINNKLIYLTSNTTNLSTLLVHLVQYEILESSEREVIMGKDSDDHRCLALYDVVRRKLTEKAFFLLLKALEDTGNQHISVALTEEISSKEKIEGLAKALQALSPTEVTEMNTVLETLDTRLNKEEGIVLRIQSRVELEESVKSGQLEILQKPKGRDSSAQTDEILVEKESSITKSKAKSELRIREQYTLHDVKLKECPLTQPVFINELVLYHVQVSGAILRKLFRNIRGLQTFKWLSFSEGGEFTLRDFDSLVESNLTSLTFKCINLDFEDELIENMSRIRHMKLWMCKCPKNLVEIIAERFPELESIEMKGIYLGTDGGVSALDLKALLGISHLKSIYIGPWTYPAFRIKPEKDPEMLEVFKDIGTPSYTWSPFLLRASNYKWEYMGEECP